MEIEIAAHEIVDAVIKVHKALGPGLLESAYQKCLAYELEKRGLLVETEVPMSIEYDGKLIDVGYRADMVVERCIIIENKMVDAVLPIHEAQLLTYLKLKKYQMGFLINWNVKLIKNGIKRYVNHYADKKNVSGPLTPQTPSRS